MSHPDRAMGGRRLVGALQASEERVDEMWPHVGRGWWLGYRELETVLSVSPCSLSGRAGRSLRALGKVS